MARLSRFERLNSKGIVVIEVDGVLGRLTAKGSEALRERPEIERRIAEDRLYAAALLAVSIRRRVTEQGDLAGQSPSKVGRRKVYLSPQFLARASLTPKKDYGSIYTNTAAMYSALGRRPETYSATGGMWAGLQARALGSGYDAFVLDFAGTSEGRGDPILVPRKAGRGKVLVAIRSQRVRNQWKGGAIYATQAVNVLLPTQAESRRLADTVLLHFWLQFADQLG